MGFFYYDHMFQKLRNNKEIHQNQILKMYNFQNLNIAYIKNGNKT